MKIAVVHNLPRGGAKRALIEWLNGLNSRHEIDLFTYTKENNASDDFKNLVRRHRVIDNLPFSSGGTLLRKASYLHRMKRVAAKLSRTINSEGYDVAFVHQCAFFQNPPVLKHITIPTVFYSQDTPQRTIYEPGLMNGAHPHFSVAEWIKDRSNRTAIRAANRVLVSSCYTREAIEKIYGVEAHVVYFGIDTDKFRPLNQPKGDFVLSVGRLHPTKGHEFVIRSVGEIPPRKRPGLLIVCESDHSERRGALETLSASSGVRLDFECNIDDGRLIRLYNEALLTLCAYRMEPLGFVALESLACGTPVVGVREAGLRETVKENEVGLLTDRDPRRMAEAIMRLMDDREMYQRLSESAPEYVRRHWSIEKSVREIESHLETVAR